MTLDQKQRRDHFDDDVAVHILAMLIGAGTDTTAAVLSNFFKIMALHPSAAARAQKGKFQLMTGSCSALFLTIEELDQVVGSSRLPNWEDQKALPYLRSLIKEVHRYGVIGSLGKGSPIPQPATVEIVRILTSKMCCSGTPHLVTKDDWYEGHRFRKGTVVYPNLTALSKDPELYPEPESFRPERFEGDILSAAESAVQQDYRRRDHFHFGFGRRICPGINVAEDSLFIVIARLLWAYDIVAKPGNQLNMEDKQRMPITPPHTPL